MNRDYNRYYQRFKVWARQPSTTISGLASLTLFTVAFFLLAAILPTFKTIATLKKEIKDSQQVNSQLTKKISSLQTAQPNYSQISNELYLLDQFLPETEEFTKLSWQLHWLASQSGVELSTGNFGSFIIVGAPAATELNLKQLDFDLTITGNYQQIKAFLKRLKGFNRLITISEINLGSKSLKQSQQITATMKLSSYFLPKKTK